MKKMSHTPKPILYSAISILALISVAGCSSNNCPLESSVYCNYLFYDSEGTAVAYNETMSVYMRLPNTGRDSLIINKVTGASNFEIPMSYFHSKDTLIIEYASLVRKDTIVVSHKSYAHVDLPECGTKYFHELLDISTTHIGIDKIEIVNPMVNYDKMENVRIFFNGVATE